MWPEGGVKEYCFDDVGESHVHGLAVDVHARGVVVVYVARYKCTVCVLEVAVVVFVCG